MSLSGGDTVQFNMIQTIISDLRAVAVKCTATADDYDDEELSQHLQDLHAILSVLASMLEEYNQ
jgi:hypothetical protein